MTAITPKHNAEERAALSLLLHSHPDYGTRALTVRECLKCPAIPKDVKQVYADIYRRNNPK